MSTKRRVAALSITGLAAALLGAALLASPAAAESGRKEVAEIVELGGLTADELSYSVSNSDGVGTPVDVNAVAEADASDEAGTQAVRPAKFDLRDAVFNGAEGDFVTPVKKQDPFPLCWSFGANAAAETSFLTEMGMTFEGSKSDAHPNGLNLSEKHTAWFMNTPLATAYFNQQGEGFAVNQDAGSIFGSGGRFKGAQVAYATSLFSTLVGPVDESVDPQLVYADANRTLTANGFYDAYGDWSISEDLRHVSSMELEETYYLPSPALFESTDPMTGLNSGYKFNRAGVDAIKDQLLAGRGVAISFHADQSLPGQATTGEFINLDTWAQYTYTTDAVMNHAVCIVGYDDTYPRSNFNAGHQPPANGAFIVKNSWGAETSEGPDKGSWGIDGTGYFYLSYYDQSLAYPEAFDFVTPNDADLTFGKSDDAEVVNEYQYAFMPGDPEAKSYPTVTSAANIYEIGGDGLVRDVAVQTRSQSTKVRYDLYLLNSDATTPTEGELVWSKEVSYPYGGFHRAEVDAPISVKKGDKVGVVVTTELPNGSYEIEQNRRISRFFATAVQADPSTHDWGQAVVNPGESFIGTPAEKATLEDGTTVYRNYTWVDTSEALKQGDEEFQKLLAENGLGEAYQACLDQLDRYQQLKVEKDTSHDPEVEAARATYQELQQKFAVMANATVPDTLDAAWYATDNYPITLTTTAADASVYRLYNPNTGEHLYTTDANEKDVLSGEHGWSYEDVAWMSPATSSTPVYRLRNVADGEHLYTADANERAELLRLPHWRDEGIAFYSDPAEGVAVYRLYNPSGSGPDSHLYTMSENERDVLSGERGWSYEDVAWYGKA